MPAVKCLCGAMTNTATSDAWEHGGKEAHECYVAWDEKTETWVKGCSWDKAYHGDQLAFETILGTGKPKKEEWDFGEEGVEDE